MEPSAIDAYWSAFFGLAPEQMRQAGVRVVPHRRLAGYEGAWIFRHARLTIISAPEARCPAIRERADGDVDFLDARWLQGAFPDTERTIGPAYDGYADASCFLPAPSLGARLLSANDLDAIQGLRAVCGEAAWEESGVLIGGVGGGVRQTFGCHVGSTLVAIAQYWPDGPAIARAGVITHPAYRDRGFGRAVRSMATEHFLRKGGVMLYQTLMSNQPAVSVAEALGYRRYATHLAVRFRRFL